MWGKRLSRRGLSMGLIGVLIAFVPAPISLAAPADRHFHLDASRFQYSPESISVNPGDRVSIDLTATDVVHGLYLDGYDLNVTAEPGQTATLSFVADRTGSFRFRCSVTCGALHPFMIGKLNVGSNDLLWRAIGLAGLAVLTGVWAVQPPGKHS